MAQPGAPSFLALAVGPYRLAIGAAHVLAVLEQVDFAHLPSIRGAERPGLDWGPLLGAGARPVAPLAVAIEAETTSAVIGVDAVDHLGTAPTSLGTAVPAFGLRHPELFGGALRDRRGLLLLLDPHAVVDFTVTSCLTLVRGPEYKKPMPEVDGESPSDGPVMTFRVGAAWLAVPVAMMERIVQTPNLVPMPLARAEHAGLLEHGDSLVPVMSLTAQPKATSEQLVAILHVRGETVGLCIDAAGRVHDALRPSSAATPAPAELKGIGRCRSTGERDVWLIDPDRLWLGADGDRQPSPTD